MKPAHQLSASKLDLALHCTHWCRSDIPHAKREMGPAAVRGVAVHLASDCHFKGLPVPEMEPEAAALWATLKGWLATQPAFTHSEFAILYDAGTDTATHAQTGETERDYLGVTALRIPMRLDLVRVDVEAGVAWVLDIKTGSKSNTLGSTENVQLATQAVGASRLFGVKRVMVGLVFPMKTKTHAPEWHEMDADALDAHAGRLHRTLRVIPDSLPVKGEHCWKFCPIGPVKNGPPATCGAWAEEAAAE